MQTHSNTNHLMEPQTIREWITLNVATAVTALIPGSIPDNPLLTLVAMVSALSLAFFNVMRGLKLYQEYRYAQTPKTPAPAAPAVDLEHLPGSVRDTTAEYPLTPSEAFKRTTDRDDS